MNIAKIFISLYILCFSWNVMAQKTAIVGGTLHVGNGKVISDAILVFQKDTIIFVGKKEEYALTEDVVQIGAEGKEIYPGLIAPNTTLGLVEVEAVRSTRDYQEVGEMNPTVRAITAYNVDSKIIPTIRANGILYSQATPQGKLISGKSSVVKLEAQTKEDAIVNEDDGIHVFWPQKYIMYDWFLRMGNVQANAKRKEYINQLKKNFDNALNLKDDNSSLNQKAIATLFNSEKRLYLHVDDAKEMLEAIAFFEKYPIKHKVIVGGRDAWKIADVLKEKNISIILSRIHDLPTRIDESPNLLYEQASLLQKVGVLYCLNYMGDMEAMGQRNLPFTAGTTVAYGVSKEDALKSISLNTAKILGVEDQLGSLEEGKIASFVISTGDLLDMRTSIVEKAYIDGKEISLESHHTKMYQKYNK